MEVDQQQPSTSAAVDKGPKKRFEVKKVRNLSHIMFVTPIFWSYVLLVYFKLRFFHPFISLVRTCFSSAALLCTSTYPVGMLDKSSSLITMA